MVPRFRDSRVLASSRRGGAFHATPGPFFSRPLYILSTHSEESDCMRQEELHKSICLAWKGWKGNKQMEGKGKHTCGGTCDLSHMNDGLTGRVVSTYK